MEGAMRIAQLLLHTDSGVVGLVLRITLAVVMFPHGAQKVLGWFGGHGFSRTMKYFTDSGIPAVFALLAIAAEFLGPLGLAVGHLLALGIAITLIIIGAGAWSLDSALVGPR
jgi:putative oxidoreductase